MSSPSGLLALGRTVRWRGSFGILRGYFKPVAAGSEACRCTMCWHVLPAALLRWMTHFPVHSSVETRRCGRVQQAVDVQPTRLSSTVLPFVVAFAPGCLHTNSVCVAWIRK